MGLSVRDRVSNNMLQRLVLISFVLTSPLGLAQGQAALEVKGSLVETRSFTARDLAALPQTEIVETKQIGSGQPQETTQVKWQGVLLRDVLKAAAMQEKEARDFRRTVILTRARDGYIALFSWGELFNSKLGDNVVVITAVDGKPLPESEGPYALRSLMDIRSGPRHVRWLQQVEVTTLR